MAAAKTLFVENGFHATGIAQIAEASGIKVGQIYRDFSSKEEIVAQIVENGMSDYLNRAALDSAIAAGDTDSVRRWIDRVVFVEHVPEEKRLLPDIMAEAGRNERIARVMQRCESRFRDGLRTALRVFAPDPEHDRAIERVAEAIQTIGFGLTNRQIAHPDLDVRPIADDLIRMVRREIDDLIAHAAPGLAKEVI